MQHKCDWYPNKFPQWSTPQHTFDVQRNAAGPIFVHKQHVKFERAAQCITPQHMTTRALCYSLNTPLGKI